MHLGIEIGGTKLQLGVGSGGGGPLDALVRLQVDCNRGADGIRQQIANTGRSLLKQYKIERVGVGFGGPVDARAGRTIKSFQIDGWDDFPLSDWLGQELQRPAVIENDSNLAGLGEARFGGAATAGLGNKQQIVFYSNVGSGIGGALVIDGTLYAGGAGAAVAEIGHLRPGPDAVSDDETVESIASGWGIAASLQRRLDEALPEDRQDAAGLISLCSGSIDRLTGKMIVAAAAAGNRLAVDVLDRSIQTYGWALAQVVTLLAPNVLIIGGGIPQIGESLFFVPLRKQVERFVMPPLRGTYQIVPAALGEEVVVHGALALAADNERPPVVDH